MISDRVLNLLSTKMDHAIPPIALGRQTRRREEPQQEILSLAKASHTLYKSTLSPIAFMYVRASQFPHEKSKISIYQLTNMRIAQTGMYRIKVRILPTEEYIIPTWVQEAHFASTCEDKYPS